MYRFCPVCGKEIVKRSPSLFVCRKCGFHFYQNPVPTTGATIINKENKILLVKRKFPPKKGYWDVPGGFIEPGESAEESLKRELKEELGISFKNFAYLSSYASKYLYKGINYSTLCFMYAVKIKDENLKVGDDVVGFKWFFRNQIPIKKMAFGFIKKAIRDYFD